MTNEQKLWQRRAGILTEGEYMDSVEERESAVAPSASTEDAGSEDPNVAAILKVFKNRVSSAKPIDTVSELQDLVTKLLDFIQATNKDALSDQEVLMALRKLTTAKSSEMQA